MRRGLIPIILLTACGFPSASYSEDQAPADGPDSVLATVNGEDLTRSEFDRFLDSMKESFPERAGLVQEQQLFVEFVLRRLLLQEADREMIRLSEDEFARFRNEWIPESGDDVPEFEDVLRDFLRIQKLIVQNVRPEVQVTLQDLLNEYDRNIESFMVEDMVWVLEIRVPSREEAEELRTQLIDADARAFQEAAQRFSNGATAEQGGVLGSFQRGDLPENFEKHIFAIKAGQIGEVFQSSQGYHLFLVEESIPRHPQRFYEVQSELFGRLASEKEREAVSDFLKQLWQDASIEIKEPGWTVELK